MAVRVEDERELISRDVGGEIVHTPHKKMLGEFVGDLDLDVVIVDPFVQSHAVSESSNEAISQVMVGLRETLTAGQGAALHLIHHNRKPMAGNSHQAGDLYAARGASAMQGGAHFVFTLADMDAESARQFGIDDDKKDFYVRLDDAKSKMAPPAGAKWFERHGEALRRCDGNLEQIGILRPWLPPATRKNGVSAVSLTSSIKTSPSVFKSNSICSILRSNVTPFSTSFRMQMRWLVVGLR